MKNLLIAFMALICFYEAGAQVKMPAPSPTQKIVQNFGLGAIELTYSRPVMKGRKIMGDLVPYNQVWRTGANGATIIKFTSPVEIMGKMIDTGSYALYTIPGENSWVVILNKGITNWGSDGYTETDDVARFTIKPTRTKEKVESFTMQFTDVKPLSTNLEIKWERTKLVLPIIAYNLVANMKADMEKALTTATKKPYWQAAQFYNEYDNNPTKALENINAAVKDNPKAFYMWLYKAKIEMAMGDRAAAKTSATTALSLSKDAKNEDYAKMSTDLLRKL